MTNTSPQLLRLSFLCFFFLFDVYPFSKSLLNLLQYHSLFYVLIFWLQGTLILALSRRLNQRSLHWRSSLNPALPGRVLPQAILRLPLDLDLPPPQRYSGSPFHPLSLQGMPCACRTDALFCLAVEGLTEQVSLRLSAIPDVHLLSSHVQLGSPLPLHLRQHFLSKFTSKQSPNIFIFICLNTYLKLLPNSSRDKVRISHWMLSNPKTKDSLLNLLQLLAKLIVQTLKKHLSNRIQRCNWCA